MWEGSDVDLLVTGIPPEVFYRAMGMLALLSTRLRMVPSESASHLLRERARTEGIRLYP